MERVKYGNELAADVSLCPVCGTPAKLRDEEIKVVRKEQVAVNLAAAEALSVMEGLSTPEPRQRYKFEVGSRPIRRSF